MLLPQEHKWRTYSILDWPLKPCSNCRPKTLWNIWIGKARYKHAHIKLIVWTIITKNYLKYKKGITNGFWNRGYQKRVCLNKWKFYHVQIQYINKNKDYYLQQKDNIIIPSLKIKIPLVSLSTSILPQNIHNYWNFYDRIKK